LDAELGRGGMGVVYRAYDLSLDRVVAVKTLPRVDSASLRRFKQEFRSLAGINHPNLAALYELVSDAQTWFFSMEFINGVNLLSYVWDEKIMQVEHADPVELPFTPLQEIRLRRGLAQLAEGLDCLHRTGVVHRDVKPSNIMVTSEERVVLLDFGLAAPLESTGQYETSADGAVGTAHYMAPEQANRAAVSPASDWYSTGVVLYQALTRRLPYEGTHLQVLANKQNRDPCQPRDLSPSVPEDLNQLCMDLLQRDPSHRPTGSEILRRLRVTETIMYQHRQHAAISDDFHQVIGRESHLAYLDACFGELKNGTSLAVFVQGHSGMGKSTLVQEFLDRIRGSRRTVVLAGRCYEQESIPFKALDNVVDELARFLCSLQPVEVEVLMPRDWAVLTQLFPVLGRVKTGLSLGRRGGQTLDETELRRRAVAALRELVTRIGDRSSLVISIDDLQWGDKDSAEVVSQLLEPPDPPAIMFLGAYRSEDANSSRFLQTLSKAASRGEASWNARELTVGPLGFDESRQLALALLRREKQQAARVAELVAAESGGSPFFVRELARFLATEAESNDAVNIDLNQVLWSRIVRLPAPARTLMEIIAVAGRPLSVSDCLQAMPPEGEPLTIVNDLRASHLLRTAGGGSTGELEIYHDRIRETISARLPAERLQAHHRCLAEMRRASVTVDCRKICEEVAQLRPWDRATVDSVVPSSEWQAIFDMSRHLDAAGQLDLALPVAVTAAYLARSQYSLEAAEQHLLVAQRALSLASRKHVYHVNASLGEVLMLLGRYHDAQEPLQRAREASDDDLARAEIEGRLGELAFKQGEIRSAADAIERALRGLGYATPRTLTAAVPFLAWQILVQVLHSWMPGRFLAKRSLAEAERELMAVRLLCRLCYAYWFKANLPVKLTAHLRAMNLAELYPPTWELAQAYSEHAPAMSLIPWIRRGIDYAQRSLEIRKDLGDLWGQAQSLHFLGIVYYAASRYEECIEHCREAIGLFQRTGDYWEVNMARFQVAASLYRLGHLQAAAEEAERMHRSGVQLGDRQATGLGLDILSKARRGEIDPATIRHELDRPPGDDAQTRSQLLQAEGVRLLAEAVTTSRPALGDQQNSQFSYGEGPEPVPSSQNFGAGTYSEAAEAFQQAYAVARAAGVCNTYVVPSLPWLATALRMQAEQVASTSPTESRRLRKRAQAAASKGLRLTRRFQNDLPHALRENAILAALAGCGKRARKLFDESLRVAERQKARYEHALTQIALGQAGLRFGWNDAEAALQEGTRVARQCESEP
jgi:eukaryotic-like serine/threonine-protein kinase